MSIRAIQASMGNEPFDLAINDIRLLNVFSGEVQDADIGIADGQVSFIGKFAPGHSSLQNIDGRHRFAVPGLIDSHMHLESSMMTPANFAAAILPLGTTSVAADPHEIANVLGVAGVAMLCEQVRELPLHVAIMAPSTVPSAPGFERSGAEITAEDVAAMLRLPGVLGLGEVMEFFGVIQGDPKINAIIAAARSAGVILDGHAPILKGKDLQAFAASGIDSDHTYMDPESVREKLSLGMCVQIQERFLTRELMEFLNSFPVQNRITLVTDDVPISRLAASGHLNAVVRKAISLGLDPLKAYRYATINPADRLRMHDRGAISPGRRADLILLDSLAEALPSLVISDGVAVAENGRLIAPIAQRPFPEAAYRTMHLTAVTEADFQIPCAGSRARVNVIVQDGKTSRTRLAQQECRVADGLLQPGSLVKMAVFHRHAGVGKDAGNGAGISAGCHSLGLLGNLDGFQGALATTYAHDCHNLTVYGSCDRDMCLAANAVLAAGGGVAAVRDGEVLCLIPLPVAGLMCADPMPVLAEKFRRFDQAAKDMGLCHSEPLTFLTLMPLAVSPEVKLTDMGIIDVMKKAFLPLVIETWNEAQP